MAFLSTAISGEVKVPMKIWIALVLMVAWLPSGAWAQSRIKDLAHIQGVRDNQLVGYGLVVGLNKTGDRRQTVFSTQSLINMLQRMGVTVAADVRVENIAAVMVTATLSPFVRAGSRIDCTVSSIGDARSLQGGTLLQTPLMAANGQVYAVAQGPVAIGGYSAGTALNGVQVNHPTSGRISNGAIVEQEVASQLVRDNRIGLVLNESDFTTASRAAQVINQSLGAGAAQSHDGRNIEVRVPQGFETRMIDLVAQIENLVVETDRIAKVVLNERTGTVVIGREVRIASVAITQGSLTIQIGTNFNVSQPNPLAQGQTVVTPQENVTVEEGQRSLILLANGANVEDLVSALNGLGATPKEMVAIFQALKAAGALHAELELI
jgi:flagellar P-ring protein precursor FlgI